MRSVAALLIVLALATGARLTADDPPTTRLRDCTEGECHAAQFDYDILHGPVAAGACAMCHEYSDPAEHAFILKREGARLCDFCHIGKTDIGGLHVHEPVEKGECLECHAPHGANTRMLLKTQPEGEMCIDCHKPIVEEMEYLHTPLQEGKCLGCHRAHSSILPMLLIEQGRTLCKQCHEDEMLALHVHAAPNVSFNVFAPEGDRIAIAAHDEGDLVHEPFLEECAECHDPHASVTPAMLIQPVQPLCESCHADIVDKIAAASVEHSAVAGDRACLNCHAPHQSEVGHLMKGDAVSVCLSCHDEETQRSDGSTVAAMSSLKTEHASLHEPISTGCDGCHDVHGADHPGLLTAPYAQAFYQPPEPGAYALCFTCHDETMLTVARSTSVTQFRNGDVNLHFIHVMQHEKKGRSCVVCHDTHAAASERLMHTSVRFGEWDVPIMFRSTEDGGSCAGGCHEPETYSRAE